MRTHSRYGMLAPRVNAEAFHRVVRAENLIAGRLDPGYSVRVDSDGILDLTFAQGEAFVVVPFAIVQGMMLLIPEREPILWPGWLPRLRADVAVKIEESVEPWLRSLVIARCANEEAVKLFGDDRPAHDVFRRARDAGFLGAAPSETVLEALGPYAYALRFSQGKTVAVCDSRGANGAALLARVAGRVDVDLGDDELTSLARRWYGLDAFDRVPNGSSYDVAVGARCDDIKSAVRVAGRAGARTVEIAAPIPPYVMVSFDPGEGSGGATFQVDAPELALRTPTIVEQPAAGGSAGRIGLVVRDDYIGAGDADVDAAEALAIRLAREGFAPAIVPANHLLPSNFDLIHVFGLRCAASTVTSLQRAGNPPVPMVVTPYADDPVDEAQWGAGIVRSALENAGDDVLREYYFGAVRDRNLEAPNVPNRGTPRLCDDAAVIELVRRASSMVASTEVEAAALRQNFAFARTIVSLPALLAPDGEAADVGSLVGDDDFVLVHAPVEPRCNQFALVRAASALGYRIVFAGCVRDVHFYNELVAGFHAGSMWLPEERLTEEELGALYRRARVFADASWSSSGLYRLARAGASGAALVAPTSGYAAAVWPGLVKTVDPASIDSIADGLREAWQAAPGLGSATGAETARVCSPVNGLRTLMSAYAAAAQPAAAGSPSV